MTSRVFVNIFFVSVHETYRKHHGRLYEFSVVKRAKLTVFLVNKKKVEFSRRTRCCLLRYYHTVFVYANYVLS